VSAWIIGIATYLALALIQGLFGYAAAAVVGLAVLAGCGLSLWFSTRTPRP